jgi:hypothetical protein
MRALTLVVLVACSSPKPAPGRPETAEDAAEAQRCAAEARGTPSEKLDGSLANAIQKWRMDVCYARGGKYPSLDPAATEARRATVIVSYTGEVEALRAAGLETGFDSNGTISGIIALRDVERLAAVPTVVRIVIEPEVHPN